MCNSVTDLPALGSVGDLGGLGGGCSSSHVHQNELLCFPSLNCSDFDVSRSPLGVFGTPGSAYRQYSMLQYRPFCLHCWNEAGFSSSMST